MPMIEAAGAKVICYPHTLPILIHWTMVVKELKSFTQFPAPTTTEMVDKLTSVALDLINPRHLRTGFLAAATVPP